jgi:hypothetical protein
MASERKKGIVIFLPSTTDNTNILKIIRLEKTIKISLIFFFYKREGVRETFKLNRLFSCRPTKGVKEFHLSFLVKILSSFLFLAQFQ